MDNFGQPTIASRFFSCMIFLLPALALTTSIGVGAIEATVILAAILYAKPLWSQRHALFWPTRHIIAAFAFNLVVALGSMSWSGWHSHFLESPIRQLPMVAAIGLVVLARPNAGLLWHGLFAGALGAAAIAFYQRFGLGMLRAEGFSMPIMFGDIALAMGLMSLASLQTFAKTRLAALPYVAFLAGFLASLLSGSRGGWLALAFAFVPLYAYGQRTVRRGMLAIILVSVSLFSAAWFAPNLDVRHRFAEFTNDIQQYQLGNADTSLGARVEMWKGALILFAEHPVAGVGRANYNQGLKTLIARGELSPATGNYHHAHSEMLNALATEGVIGALALFFLYAAPFSFFMRALRRDDASRPYALAGLLLVLSFIAFGLTQVLFAHHIGAAFYALAVCVLAGLCVMLSARSNDPRAAVKVA